MGGDVSMRHRGDQAAVDQGYSDFGGEPDQLEAISRSSRNGVLFSTV